MNLVSLIAVAHDLYMGTIIQTVTTTETVILTTGIVTITIIIMTIITTMTVMTGSIIGGK